MTLELKLGQPIPLLLPRLQDVLLEGSSLLEVGTMDLASYVHYSIDHPGSVGFEISGDGMKLIVTSPTITEASSYRDGAVHETYIPAQFPREFIKSLPQDWRTFQDPMPLRLIEFYKLLGKFVVPCCFIGNIESLVEESDGRTVFPIVPVLSLPRRQFYNPGKVNISPNAANPPEILTADVYYHFDNWLPQDGETAGCMTEGTGSVRYARYTSVAIPRSGLSEATLMLRRIPIEMAIIEQRSSVDL